MSFFLNFIHLFYFWLWRIFIALRGLSLVVASEGYSVALCGLLSVVASFVVDTGSRNMGFSSFDSET